MIEYRDSRTDKLARLLEVMEWVREDQPITAIWDEGYGLRALMVNEEPDE